MGWLIHRGCPECGRNYTLDNWQADVCPHCIADAEALVKEAFKKFQKKKAK